MVNLRWFRKHQKIMLVVFGVTLMFIFVIGMVVPFGMTGNTVSREEMARFNQPIVKWSGGTMTRGQMQRLKELHFGAINLQEAILSTYASNSPQGPFVRRIQPIGDVGSIDEADRAIFARVMRAQYAKDNLGIVISDDAVLEYLSNLAGTVLSQQELVSFCRKTNSNVGYNQIHEYLKMELASMRLEDIIGESFNIGWRGAAPSNVLDAWQAYIQNEKQIECAIEEFKASDFVSQITEKPAIAELRKLYDEGKSRERDSLGEKPGFKRPRKVRVEYVVASGAAFLDLAIQDVTAEQVLAEYNRLVEAKDPLVMEDIPSAETPVEQKLDGEKLQDDPAPEMKKETPESTDPAPSPDASDDKPPGEPAADEKAGTPDTKEPSDSEKNKSPTDGGGGVDFRQSSNRHYVSLRKHQQDSANPSETKQDPAPDPAEPAQSVTTPPVADAAPVQDETKKNDPAAAIQTPAEKAAPAAPQQPTQRPKKLDAELELKIKQKLKGPEAAEKQRDAADKAKEKMEAYSFGLADYESGKSLPLSEQPAKPMDLDLKAFADEQHLKYSQTEVCSYDDLMKDPIGGAIELETNPSTGQFGSRRIADEIFLNFDRKQLHSVDEINNMMVGDKYVFWITEKVDSSIPGLDEVQTEINDFWKAKKSVEMALAAATKVRDEFRASGKLLAEEHKDRAKLTGGFRWFQSTLDQTSYGAPKGVMNAGEEFMSVAFGLKPNELGAALNDDRTAAYVIQLVAADPRSDEQMRDQFLSFVSTVRQIVPSPTSNFYNRKSIGKIVDGMNDEMKVEWLAY